MTRIDIPQDQGHALTLICTAHSHNYTICLSGRRARIEINLIVLGGGQKELSPNISIFHCAEHTSSRVTVRCLAADSSNIKPKILIHVSPEAGESAASLSVGTLLISNHARVEASPSLEILNNSSVAKHSLTVSDFANDQMFYLTARGIEEAQAKRLLTLDFVNDLTSQVPQRFVRKVSDYISNNIV